MRAKRGEKRAITMNRKPERRSYDVAIVGGAVIGSSVAWWLGRMSPKLRILVIERDPTYARASTALSVASIRQQYTQPVNVRISRFGIDFIRNARERTGLDHIPPSLDLRENGYLFLADSERAEMAMRAAAAMQRSEGASTEILGPEEIRRRFPHLGVGGIRLGSFGPRDEGWFDNMALLSLFRDGAGRQGAEYVADEAVGISRSGVRAESVELASGASVSAGAIVNAAGTRAAQVMQMAGMDLPVEPRKRTVFLVEAPGARIPDAPLLVDPLGFYLRPEGERWLCGATPAKDSAADPDDFEPDHAAFEEVIWPRLHARSACFDRVKVRGVWAGHYAYNVFDRNALVGAMPRCGNLYAANGFSGHGLQQSPAVGRGVAELILHGGFRTLDLSELEPGRIAANRAVIEEAII